MKTFLLTCSIDGINIDYETTINAEQEPSFWDCYEIATVHGCELWSLSEI